MSEPSDCTMYLIDGVIDAESFTCDAKELTASQKAGSSKFALLFLLCRYPGRSGRTACGCG
jgi:hypothetical protein